MKNIIVMGVAGIGLFVGSVVGLLGVTGRLNHEGTQGIPLVSGLFPAPPEVEGEGEDGDGHGDGHGDATEDAGAHGDAAHGAEDTSSGTERNLDKAVASTDKLDDIFEEAAADPHGGGHGEAPAAHGDPEAETHDSGHRVLDDLFAEEPAADAHGGGGHGEDDSHGAHGEETSRDLNALKQHNQRPGAGEDTLDKEHRYVMEALQNATEYEYETGRYFDFKGQSASISPDEINRFVALLRERAGRIDSKGKALGEREKELQTREMDVADQQQALARARQAFEARQRQFDTQVEDFNLKVRLIQSQEEPMLKSNAKALEAFEVEVATGWVMNLWQDTEEGRNEVLKTMFFMSKDKSVKLLNEIGKLDKMVLQDIMRKRKELAVEPAAPR